jgi:site-specific recombinase XerD
MPRINEISLPLLDDFLLNLQTNNYSLETVYNYEKDLEVFQNFLREIKIEFASIDKRTILNYKAYLVSRDRQTALGQKSQKQLSSFSINRMLCSLRSYLKFLADMDYRLPVSADMIKLVKTEKKYPRVGDLEQIIKLIESPTRFEKDKLVALRNRAILETFFSTGMRISELVNLKKDQINDSGRVFIRGKGKKERFVYLTERAQEHLKKYLAARGGSASAESPFLFLPLKGKNIHKKDKRISPNYIEEKLKQYRERLGLSMPVSPHGLRRAFATYLAEQGASPTAIQILLGHESLDTTTRYVKASDHYAEESFRKFHPLKE